MYVKLEPRIIPWYSPFDLHSTCPAPKLVRQVQPVVSFAFLSHLIDTVVGRREKTPVLIGIAGRLHSGKSTFTKELASVLSGEGIHAQIFPFAEEIKRIARDEFGWDGEKDEKGRILLAVLGSDAGRKFNPDIWINKWIPKVEKSTAQVIITDDIRFDNEVQAIRDRGGFVIEVIRSDYVVPPGQDLTHASEQGVSDVDMAFDFRSGDCAAMRIVASLIVEKLMGQDLGFELQTYHHRAGAA